MSHSDDQPNSFAALIGKIEPIKPSKTVKDFGRQPKIRQKRRIELKIFALQHELIHPKLLSVTIFSRLMNGMPCNLDAFSSIEF
ncbi:hypothetical protein [Suttonella ornithocola]|uniref:hypothetical protein n=1 Tax=Suttonella ornithocola TaxID=279832 RepID=UPI0011604677|nr:hypothetical protein [Suttonella ornithocola]